MISTINQELHDLIRPLDVICLEDAETTVRAVCNKLKEIIKDAYIVDVYWKRNGGSSQYILDPFVSIRSEIAEKAGMVIVSEKTGILPWVQEKGKIAWIDEVKNKDWDNPVLNLAAIDGIKAEKKPISENDIKVEKQPKSEIKELESNQNAYIQPSPKLNNFSPQTECIMAYPLKHRNQVWGVLSIELTKPKEFDSKINLELYQTAKLLASLLWKFDVQRQNAEDTKEAVVEFMKTISKPVEDVIPLTLNPSGFLARPFDEEGKFDLVERAIQYCIPHIEIFHYMDQGKDLIIKEIKEHIHKSHFCIADITGLNVNVMIELGMMMIDKDKHNKIIIIKNFKDKTKIPFDITQHPVYHYILQDNKLLIKDTAGGPDQLFKPTLDNLTEKYIRKMK